MLKSSAQRGVRKQVMELYPYFTEELLELVLPKKATIHQTKCRDHLLLMVVEGEPLFFQQFDGPLMPSLRVLHKCTTMGPGCLARITNTASCRVRLLFVVPDMMSKVQVDKGAIKFVLSGADVMCPGLTSAGGSISPDLKEGTIVVCPT